ncbi:MAG: hypothetical protein CMN32_02145 [Saprospirales bacterium]|nr:hypothetical protein [Saprospirales bacterium]
MPALAGGNSRGRHEVSLRKADDLRKGWKDFCQAWLTWEVAQEQHRLRLAEGASLWGLAGELPEVLLPGYMQAGQWTGAKVFLPVLEVSIEFVGGEEAPRQYV